MLERQPRGPSLPARTLLSHKTGCTMWSHDPELQQSTTEPHVASCVPHFHRFQLLFRYLVFNTRAPALQLMFNLLVTGCVATIMALVELRLVIGFLSVL